MNYANVSFLTKNLVILSLASRLAWDGLSPPPSAANTGGLGFREVSEFQTPALILTQQACCPLSHLTYFKGVVSKA